MKKRILILADRSGLCKSLINLGDRALTDGLWKLLAMSNGPEIVSGGWKNFPSFTIDSFRDASTDDDIASVFERWTEKVLSTDKNKAEQQRRLLRLYRDNALVKNPVIAGIDAFVASRHTLPLTDIIAPRLFGDYFAVEVIERIKRSDSVVFNGGGLLADHLEKYLPGFLFECYLAKKLGKKVYAVNQTLAVKKPKTRRIVSFVYRMIDGHLVREPLSIRELVSYGIREEKVIGSCDSAFALDPSGWKLPPAPGIGEGTVALIIRGDRPVRYEQWGTVVNHLVRRRGKKVLFVHTCKAHDDKVARKLSREWRIDHLKTMHDYPETIGILEKCDMVISDRYHGCIFSILAGTPIVPAHSNTMKVKGLFELFDYPIKPVLLEDKVGAEQLIANIDMLYSDYAAIKAEIPWIRDWLKKKVYADYLRFHMWDCPDGQRCSHHPEPVGAP